jgi:putative ABC transport system permease protein
VSYRDAARGRIVLRSLFLEAAANLNRRRMQAALSAFGIATGIAAVVLLVALVSGLHRMALSTLNAAGGNVVQVRVDTDPSTSDPKGFPLTLRPEDADALLRTTGYFDLAAAENGANAVVRGVVVQGRTAVQTSGGGFALRNVSRALSVQIRGVTPSGFELLNLKVAAGRLPLAEEFAEGRRVAVLGGRIARQIFNTRDPIGEILVLGDWTFRVIGVLDLVGEPEGEFRAPQDQVVYAPFATVASVFRGSDAAGSLSLRLRDPNRSTEAVADARGILTRRQQRLGETSGVLTFTTTLDRLAEMNLIINGLKILVGLVGGIGLFVGAVGVANVLLVSVRERTQEIGVRRAIGATRRDIFFGSSSRRWGSRCLAGWSVYSGRGS